MTFRWPLLTLSSSCFQLASPVFLLSNYVEVDTNQRGWEKAIEIGKANCFKSFVLLSVLYAFFFWAACPCCPIPVDVVVGNPSVGASDAWSCSSFSVTSSTCLVIRSLNYFCSHACIWSPLLFLACLYFPPLKSLPPISLHHVIKFIKSPPFANGKIGLHVRHLVFISPCQIGSIDLPHTCCICTNMWFIINYRA